MLPFLSTTDNSTTVSSVSAPPPRNFRPIHGTPTDVHLRRNPTTQPRGLTAAQRAGLRYEARAQHFLSSLLLDYWPQPLVIFTDDSGHRTVIPDGLLYVSASGLMFIVEGKVQHMPEAWWQLRQLYQPVLNALPKVRGTRVIEVCRSYDPAMGFPEEVERIDDLAAYVAGDPPDRFGVFTWRP